MRCECGQQMLYVRLLNDEQGNKIITYRIWGCPKCGQSKMEQINLSNDCTSRFDPSPELMKKLRS